MEQGHIYIIRLKTDEKNTLLNKGAKSDEKLDSKGILNNYLLCFLVLYAVYVHLLFDTWVIYFVHI